MLSLPGLRGLSFSLVQSPSRCTYVVSRVVKIESTSLTWPGTFDKLQLALATVVAPSRWPFSKLLNRFSFFFSLLKPSHVSNPGQTVNPPDVGRRDLDVRGHLLWHISRWGSVAVAAKWSTPTLDCGILGGHNHKLFVFISFFEEVAKEIWNINVKIGKFYKI